MTARRAFLGVATVVSLVLPVLAYGQTSQSALAGVVRDTTGAVLPGVTVEAASPALIEKVRAVTTDSSGVYRIVDLRPGIYTITFTLPGFNTVRIANFELRADFTATVNADMNVGELAETISVTGEAPLVDVQSTTRSAVYDKEVHREPAEQPADPEPRADDSGRGRRPEHRRPGLAELVGARQPHFGNQQRHRRHVGSARVGGRSGGHLLHERRERPGSQRSDRRRRCGGAGLGRLDERDSEGRRQHLQLEHHGALCEREPGERATSRRPTSTRD